MKMPLRRPILRWLVAGSVALTIGGGIPAAAAQDKYPDHPVRIVVPFAAGGLGDIAARLVGDKLSEKFGERFFVDNQPGAGGINAARAVLAGGDDGYTVAFITNATAISAAIFNHLPYDPIKDFVPISGIGFFDLDFVTEASSPFRSLGDFLKAAKERPGTLNLGSTVVGSTQNLTAQLLKAASGADIVLVPFRATPDEVVALLRGDIQLAVDFYAALRPSIDGGKVRAIATSGRKRSPELPDVPTVAESGVPGFDVTSWNALYAPAGTPAAVVDTLNKVLQDALSEPEFRKRALDLGIDPTPWSPAEVDARMRADIVKWAKVIADAHIPKQ
jgi:tripartite-type tricarboxylate transporter receptor subunit TctC